MDSPKISRQKQKSSVILFHSGLVFLTLFNWLRSPPIVKPRIFTKTSDGSLSSWCISLPTIFCYKSFFFEFFESFWRTKRSFIRLTGVCSVITRLNRKTEHANQTSLPLEVPRQRKNSVLIYSFPWTLLSEEFSSTLNYFNYRKFK